MTTNTKYKNRKFVSCEFQISSEEPLLGLLAVQHYDPLRSLPRHVTEQAVHSSSSSLTNKICTLGVRVGIGIDFRYICAAGQNGRIRRPLFLRLEKWTIGR